jgi:hypothetical protein
MLQMLLVDTTKNYLNLTLSFNHLRLKSWLMKHTGTLTLDPYQPASHKSNTRRKLQHNYTDDRKKQ